MPECPDGHSGHSMTTSTYGNHDDDDDCNPDMPGCGPDKSDGYAGGSGYHDGQPPKSDGRQDCPETCPKTGSSKPDGTNQHCTPPDATTGGCNTCKAASMTITGTVDPNGTATQYKFEFGTTPAFGNETDWTSAGDGTTAKSVSESIDSLAPGTKIYYRIVAKSIRGTANGATKYCATAASGKPNAVTGSNTVASTTATINGTVDPNGASATAYFQWGKTSSLGSTTGSQNVGSGDNPQNASAGLSGLAPNTTYYYRVVGTNSKGTAYGDIKSFTTPADKPDAVTGGNTPAPTSATIKGTADPNGAATTAYFQWGKTSSLGTNTGSQSVGSGNDPANVSAGLSGLTPGTTYYYRVVATNAKGTDYGDVLSFKTPADKPKCSTGGYGSLSKTGAKIDGSVNPSGGATTYYFEYGKTTSYGSKSGSISAGSGISDVSASSTLSSLSSNTKYYYRVVAVNSVGTVYGAQQTFTTSK
jgi:phosphodiesterase/alkaline phosphatase D-like protein